MYMAGTYLGGTQAVRWISGQLSFAQRLRDPKLLANLVKPQNWNWPGATTTTGVNTSQILPMAKPQGKALADAIALQKRGIMEAAMNKDAISVLGKTASRRSSSKASYFMVFQNPWVQQSFSNALEFLP